MFVCMARTSKGHASKTKIVDDRTEGLTPDYLRESFTEASAQVAVDQCCQTLTRFEGVTKSRLMGVNKSCSL